MAALEHLSIHERVQLQFEVEQFLYHEASLLDDRKLDEWLALCADDIHYWMPIRRTTTAREVAHEFTAPDAMAFFNDNKAMLTLRVQRLAVGRAWAEDPPSRTRHFVANVRVREVVGEDVHVGLNFHLYRTRLDSEEDHWYGRREDVLRRSANGFVLARRHIFLDQTIILAQNMSNLF